jgi:biopolymer transport protein ExbD
VAPKVRNFSINEAPSVIIQVSKGAKAGLATQVMDQALLAGAKAVKLSVDSK